MFFVSKSEPRSTECSLEMVRSIDKEHGIGKVMFLSKFVENTFCQRGCSRRKQPYMEDIVRVWIGGSVQPIAMFVKLNHRLVECDVIRFLVICRL